jgi:hypothetical protein
MGVMSGGKNTSHGNKESLYLVCVLFLSSILKRGSKTNLKKKYNNKKEQIPS